MGPYFPVVNPSLQAWMQLVFSSACEESFMFDDLETSGLVTKETSRWHSLLNDTQRSAKRGYAAYIALDMVVEVDGAWGNW
jgi:hypothetical protein